MPEETKGNPPTPQPPADKPADAAAKPVAPAAAAKPAAPAPATAVKPAAPAKPAGPVPEPWNAPLPTGLKGRFGSAIKEASTYLGQNYLVVDRAVVIEVLHILRDEEQFDYCVDITAVHYPKKELQFEIVWILYSFARNQRMRVKTQIKDGEPAPSVVAIWPAANWLERECFDMFGTTFEGHPDLRRILLPDGWKGYPLRKEYSILLQDKEWVQANLGIESGQ
jgi:NADH-quinone oxidoreductase subunit C